jgi:predicted transposase/invertase (TIGR01784 family)
MRFINPKTDFGFKKIFGSEQSEGILISFLDGILYDGEPTIESLTILNPYQAPKIRGMKDTYLDVKALLHSGETVIIEMQVLNIDSFEKRILYNAAKAYSTQLDAGQKYDQLNPVIALTLTDFAMFPEIPAVTTRFILKEKDFLFDYPLYDLELVFVELPKFQQSLEELTSLSDRWLYFMQNAPSFQQIPALLATLPALEQAFTIANQANLSREELEDLEHQEIFIQDQRNAIFKATKQADQQGFTRGIEQGSRQAQFDMARRSLALLDDGMISQLTGLTIEEVQELRLEV